MRQWGLLVGSVALAAGLLAPVASAQPAPSVSPMGGGSIRVPLPATFTVGVVDTPEGCAVVPYFDVPKRPGISTYVLRYYDGLYRGWRTVTYPPLPAVEVPQLVPNSGIIRQTVAGLFGSGPCLPTVGESVQMYTDRFQVPGRAARAFGVVPRKGRFLLSGVLRDEDGQPLAGVAVTVSGEGSSRRARTASDGSYALIADRGRYRVSVDRRYSAVKGPGCRPVDAGRACEVELTRDRTADFVRNVALVITPRVSCWAPARLGGQTPGEPFTVALRVRNQYADETLAVGPIWMTVESANIELVRYGWAGDPPESQLLPFSAERIQAAGPISLGPRESRVVFIAAETTRKGDVALLRFQVPSVARVPSGTDPSGATGEAPNPSRVLVQPGSEAFIDRLGWEVRDSVFAFGMPMVEAPGAVDDAEDPGGTITSCSPDQT